MDGAGACGVSGLFRIDRGDDGFAAAREAPAPRFDPESAPVVAVRGARLGQGKHRSDRDRRPAAYGTTARVIGKGGKPS